MTLLVLRKKYFHRGHTLVLQFISNFKEISEITGVSINTSLGRMRYALLNMRKMANDHHIELRLEQ